MHDEIKLKKKISKIRAREARQFIEHDQSQMQVSKKLKLFLYKQSVFFLQEYQPKGPNKINAKKGTTKLHDWQPSRVDQLFIM